MTIMTRKPTRTRIVWRPSPPQQAAPASTSVSVTAAEADEGGQQVRSRGGPALKAPPRLPMQTPRWNFASASNCRAEQETEKRRGRLQQHPQGQPGYHNVIVAAASPDHFEHLVMLQGPWAPPAPPVDEEDGSSPGGAVPEAVRQNLGAACEAWRRRVCAATRMADPICRTFADVKAEVARYMRRYKRGIYVCVRAGRLVIYQPFNAAKGHGPQAESNEITREAWREINRKVRQRWWADPRDWYVNHCWVDAKQRSVTTPTEWWTTEYLGFFLMLEMTLPPGALGDADLIINNADFPVVHKADPRPPRLPVLTAVQHPDYLDLPVPSTDDIEYVTQRVYLHLPSKGTCRDLYLTPFQAVPWGRKKRVAVFRGSTSGCGVTARTNPRIELAKLGAQWPELLDAGVTHVDDDMPRVNRGVVEVLQADEVSVPLVPPLPLHAQSAYKYILNVEGYVAAFRYLFLLSSGSLVINVRCPYTMWYEPAIEPRVHVVEVDSVREVVNAVRWAQDHDDEAKDMAEHAAALHRQLATPECMAGYMALLLRHTAVASKHAVSAAATRTAR